MMKMTSLAPTGNRVEFRRSTRDFGDMFPNFAVVTCASGTAALALAIEQAKVNNEVECPEVILPAYGCPDLIAACMYAKAKPVLVDLAPNSPRMNLEHVKSAVTKNTVAILAVTFLGIRERFADLRKIVGERSISIIEDSAQWFPHSSNDSFTSDLVVLSFGRGKPVSMTGGGALLGNRISKTVIRHVNNSEKQESGFLDKLKYRVKATLFNFIIMPSVYGFISRLPFLSIGETHYIPLNTIEPMPIEIALLLEANCTRYQSENDISDELANILGQKKLTDAGIIDLGAHCGLENNRQHLRFPILFESPEMRDKCAKIMHKKGLGASKMYGEPLFKIDGINSKAMLHSEDSEAEKFSKCVLTLPTHEFVSKKNLKQIETVLLGLVNQSVTKVERL